MALAPIAPVNIFADLPSGPAYRVATVGGRAVTSFPARAWVQGGELVFYQNGDVEFEAAAGVNFATGEQTLGVVGYEVADAAGAIVQRRSVIMAVRGLPEIVITSTTPHSLAPIIEGRPYGDALTLGVDTASRGAVTYQVSWTRDGRVVDRQELAQPTSNLRATVTATARGSGDEAVRTTNLGPVTVEPLLRAAPIVGAAAVVEGEAVYSVDLDAYVTGGTGVRSYSGEAPGPAPVWEARLTGSVLTVTLDDPTALPAPGASVDLTIPYRVTAGGQESVSNVTLTVFGTGTAEAEFTARDLVITQRIGPRTTFSIDLEEQVVGGSAPYTITSTADGSAFGNLSISDNILNVDVRLAAAVPADGETSVLTIPYTVTDSTGSTTSADVIVTLIGDARLGEIDLTTPVPTSIAPPKDATGVDRNRVLETTWSAPIERVDSRHITVLQGSTAINTWAITTSFDRTQTFITPTGTGWTGDARIRVQMRPGAVETAAGIQNARIDELMDFGTRAGGTPAPEVDSRSVSLDASGVSTALTGITLTTTEIVTAVEVLDATASPAPTGGFGPVTATITGGGRTVALGYASGADKEPPANSSVEIMVRLTGEGGSRDVVAARYTTAAASGGGDIAAWAPGYQPTHEDVRALAGSSYLGPLSAPPAIDDGNLPAGVALRTASDGQRYYTLSSGAVLENLTLNRPVVIGDVGASSSNERNPNGVRVSGCVIDISALREDNQINPITVREATDVVIRNNSVIGSGYGGSVDAGLGGGEKAGVWVLDADGIEIAFNEFTNLPNDGIILDVGPTASGSLTANYLHAFKNYEPVGSPGGARVFSAGMTVQPEDEVLSSDRRFLWKAKRNATLNALPQGKESNDDLQAKDQHADPINIRGGGRLVICYNYYRFDGPAIGMNQFRIAPNNNDATPVGSWFMANNLGADHGLSSQPWQAWFALAESVGDIVWANNQMPEHTGGNFFHPTLNLRASETGARLYWSGNVDEATGLAVDSPRAVPAEATGPDGTVSGESYWMPFPVIADPAGDLIGASGVTVSNSAPIDTVDTDGTAVTGTVACIDGQPVLLMRNDGTHEVYPGEHTVTVGGGGLYTINLPSALRRGASAVMAGRVHLMGATSSTDTGGGTGGTGAASDYTPGEFPSRPKDGFVVYDAGWALGRNVAQVPVPGGTAAASLEGRTIEVRLDDEWQDLGVVNGGVVAGAMLPARGILDSYRRTPLYRVKGGDGSTVAGTRKFGVGGNWLDLLTQSDMDRVWRVQPAKASTTPTVIEPDALQWVLSMRDPEDPGPLPLSDVHWMRVTNDAWTPITGSNGRTLQHEPEAWRHCANYIAETIRMPIVMAPMSLSGKGIDDLMESRGRYADDERRIAQRFGIGEPGVNFGLASTFFSSSTLREDLTPNPLGGILFGVLPDGTRVSAGSTFRKQNNVNITLTMTVDEFVDWDKCRLIGNAPYNSDKRNAMRETIDHPSYRDYFLGEGDAPWGFVKGRQDGQSDPGHPADDTPYGCAAAGLQFFAEMWAVASGSIADKEPILDAAIINPGGDNTKLAVGVNHAYVTTPHRMWGRARVSGTPDASHFYYDGTHLLSIDRVEIRNPATHTRADWGMFYLSKPDGSAISAADRARFEYRPGTQLGSGGPSEVASGRTFGHAPGVKVGTYWRPLMGLHVPRDVDVFANADSRPYTPPTVGDGYSVGAGTSTPPATGPDGEAPSVDNASRSPALDATGVVRTQPYTARFTEPVTLTPGGDGVTVWIGNATDGGTELTGVSWSTDWSADRRTITVTPAGDGWPNGDGVALEVRADVTDDSGERQRTALVSRALIIAAADSGGTSPGSPTVLIPPAVAAFDPAAFDDPANSIGNGWTLNNDGTADVDFGVGETSTLQFPHVGIVSTDVTRRIRVSYDMSGPGVGEITPASSWGMYRDNGFGAQFVPKSVVSGSTQHNGVGVTTVVVETSDVAPGADRVNFAPDLQKRVEGSGIVTVSNLRIELI